VARRPSEDGPHSAKRKRPGQVRKEEDDFKELLREQEAKRKEREKRKAKFERRNRKRK
jgi:hypothetical protein